MYDRKQAQLLEQYLATLRHDPQAAPPPDLDPVVGEMARKFKQEALKQQRNARQQSNRPSSDIRARVWQKAMADHQREQIIPLPPRHHERHPSSPFTLAAAVSALVVFFAVMLVIAAQPRGEESFATALTPEDEGAETLVVTPDTNSAVTSTPIEVSRTLAINYMPARVGQTVNGTLSSSQPMAIYEYDIAENMLVIARVEAEGFRPRLYHTVGGDILQSAAQITIMAAPSGSDTVVTTAMPTMVPPVAPFLMNQGVVYVSDVPNPIWFVANAGETIQVVVSSLDTVTHAPFELTTTVVKPMVLQAGNEQTFTFSKEQPFAYFNFEGRAEERITLSVNGEKTRNLILFDTADPRSSMNMLPSTTFQLDSLRFSLDSDGTQGILIEPENPDSTGTINVSLTSET